MSTNNKEMLLAEFMDGKILEAELLLNHPELKEDIDLIKLSKRALGRLEDMQSERVIDIPSDRYWLSRVPKAVWYTAASILIFLSISILITRLEQSNTSRFSDFVSSEETDIRLLGLWSIWESTKINKSEQKQLLDLATRDENSNIRFLALQKFMDQPLELSESELLEYIKREESFSNQTVWIELWNNIHNKESKELKQWLNKGDINPIVKAYGDQLLKL